MNNSNLNNSLGSAVNPIIQNINVNQILNSLNQVWI